MAEDGLTLEELKKIRDKLARDLKDVQHEEKVVFASTTNPEQMNLINELKNYNKIPRHSRMLLNSQNSKLSNNIETDDNKLINYYRTLTGVTVNNITLKSEPGSKDSIDKYYYEVDANIENLQFNISYCTPSQTDETIEQLQITLARPTYQQEIQEGLDFFAHELPNIPIAILFLKSVNKLHTIRRNICKELMMQHKQFLDIAIVEATGQICFICKGIAHPTDYFVVYWQIKWDSKMYSAKDAFRIQIQFSDKQLVADTKPLFERICQHSKWSNLSEKEKLGIFKNTVNLVVEADSRDFSSETETTFSEYLSNG